MFRLVFSAMMNLRQVVSILLSYVACASLHLAFQARESVLDVGYVVFGTSSYVAARSLS